MWSAGFSQAPPVSVFPFGEFPSPSCTEVFEILRQILRPPYPLGPIPPKAIDHLFSSIDGLSPASAPP